MQRRRLHFRDRLRLRVSRLVLIRRAFLRAGWSDDVQRLRGGLAHLRVQGRERTRFNDHRRDAQHNWRWRGHSSRVTRRLHQGGGQGVGHH